MNSPTQPEFIAIRHGMEYLMHQPHEPIIYSTKNILKLNEIPNQFFFKAGSEEVKNIRNTKNFFTHNGKHIMKDISLTGAPSPQHITSSMTPSYIGVPRKNMRHYKAVPIQKQDKFTQVC